MQIAIQQRPGFEQRAVLLSERLSLPLLEQSQDHSSFSLILAYDERGLGISMPDSGAGAIRVDFLSGASRHRLRHGGGKNQQLAKAVGLDRKNFAPIVFDLTAGLGRDAFVMASLGAHVTLVERHPVVYELLNDGLARARLAADPQLAAIVGHMSPVQSDALDYLQGDVRADVIYLDPMFPPSSKSAKVKKEMQLFHRLVGFDEQSSELLDKAVDKARYRVVVKRPAYAPALAGSAPSVTLKGKSTRFDVYSRKRIP